MLCTICIILVLLGFLRTRLTYDSDVQRFERAVRKQINPADLQSWATNLLTMYSRSNSVDSEYRSFEITDLPVSLRNVSGLTPVAFLFANPSPERAFTRISWGSGFLGHWGFEIGGPEFAYPVGNVETWKPGIYFWR